MQMNYSKDQACLELKDLINNWLSEKDSRNIAALARGAGVGENCIRRIVNSNSMPVTENLQKIVVFIKGADQNKNILSSLSSNLQSHIKFELSYLNFEEVQEYVSIADIENQIPTFVERAIFERSSIHNGISIQEVKDLFGQNGVNSVEKLVKNNFVTTQNDYVIVNEKLKYHSWSFQSAKSLACDSLQFFFKTHTNTNYMFNLNEGVNITGYCEIMDALEKAHKAISQIAKNNPGKIPLTVTGAMDTMTTHDFFAKKVELTNE